MLSIGRALATFCYTIAYQLSAISLQPAGRPKARLDVKDCSIPALYSYLLQTVSELKYHMAEAPKSHGILCSMVSPTFPVVIYSLAQHSVLTPLILQWF